MSLKLQCKVVLLGDTGVGKSSLVLRYVRNQFIDFAEPTIGAAFLSNTITLPNRQVKFEIWDTAGQERYRSLAPMYYRDAPAAVVVYDITNKDSFSLAKEWVTKLRAEGAPGVVIALAGNKCDLLGKRVVSHEEARQYAAEQKIIFFETSAKSRVNVDEVFKELAKGIPADVQENDETYTYEYPEPEKKKCC